MKSIFKHHIFTRYASCFLSCMLTILFLASFMVPAQASTTTRLSKIVVSYDGHDPDDKNDVPEAVTGERIDKDKLVVTATYKLKTPEGTEEREAVLSSSQFELSTDTVIKGLRDVTVTYTYKGVEKHDTFKLRGIGEVDDPEFEETEKGKWYMIDTNGKMIKDSLRKIDGDTYLFDKDGYLVSGWQNYNDHWYYFDEDDYEAYTGWHTIDSTVYYFGDTDCIMVTNAWIQHNGIWYYFGGSGLRVSGWITIRGSWYYMNPDYTMHTGWLNENEKWYFLNPDGSMVTGWKELWGVWYYFADNGVMAANTFIDNYYVNSNGAWVPGADIS